jgi:hypothetical protein
VVGIFPNRGSLVRLTSMVLAEQDDEWATADRRYFTAEFMRLVDVEEESEDRHELLAQIA